MSSTGVWYGKDVRNKLGPWRSEIPTMWASRTAALARVVWRCEGAEACGAVGTTEY